MSTRAFAFAAGLAFFVSASPASAAKKAFLVGIDHYQYFDQDHQLKHSVNDANDVGQTLRALGYDTVILTNASDVTRTGFLMAWQKLLNGLKEGDDVVLYYSGHGVEVQGTNYLVPTDTPNADNLGGSDILKQVLISFPTLLDNLKQKLLNGVVWILDACRNNPFEIRGKSLGGSAGLAEPRNPAGTIILYSAKAGQKALESLPNDLPNQRNSLYTRVLLQMIPNYKSVPIWDLARDIKTEVAQLAKPQEQSPAYYDELDLPWCIGGCARLAVRTSFQTAAFTIHQPSAFQMVETLQRDKSLTNTSRREPNAVFLGKKSAAATCTDGNLDSSPFGCALLRAVVPQPSPAATEASRNRFIGTALAPETEVNVRLYAPGDSDKDVDYICAVETLTPKSSITLSGIKDVAYGAQDVRYWGTIEGEPKDCPRR
jgi:hypothetical protein